MTDTKSSIREYIRGKVRNIIIPDNAILSICADAGINPETEYTDATLKQRELALAWLYVWIASSPVQSGTTHEADADWTHSSGGERMSANVLKQYLAMANKIFDKYDLPAVGVERWGMIGRGLKNPQKYR